MNLSFAIECTSLDQFLAHWSQRYNYDKSDDPNFYDPFIGKALTERSLRKLFEWKNGSTLSKAKARSVSENYPLSFSKSELEKQYLNPKHPGGAIWNIFYMHCIDPDVWPIFDQHTYRAMHFIQTGDIEELSNAKKEIYRVYKNEYMPFVLKLGPKKRKTDKALFTFGQFLKKAKRYR